LTNAGPDGKDSTASVALRQILGNNKELVEEESA